MRNFVINKLTQSSAWIGIAVILSAMIMPRSVTIFLGLLLILNDDAKLTGLFSGLRARLEKWWVA